AIRARLEDAEVSVGRAPRRSHIEVRVVEGARSLSVQVTIRDAAGRVAGKDVRRLPDQGDCPAILEAATLIVVRAATPMTAGHLALPKPATTPPRTPAPETQPPPVPQVRSPEPMPPIASATPP